MTTKLQDRRVWFGGGVLAAVVILLVSWFFAIHPQLSSASNLYAQRDNTDSQNLALTSKINKLKTQDKNLSLLTGQLKQALEALPFDSGLPAFTDQVTAQAASTGVKLTSISVGGFSAATVGGTTSGSSGGVAGSSVLSVPITLATSGKGTALLAFLDRLQADGPRRALVTSTSIAPTGSAKSVTGNATMTVQLTVYCAPLSKQAQAQLEKLLRGDISG